MDNNGHREINGRSRPPQAQWFMQHQPSMKHIMTIMAERDAAIQERNLALSEKKTALAERDMALLQRDSAMVERNSAIIERDNAVAALQYHETAINNECQIPRGMKNEPHLQSSEAQYETIALSPIVPGPTKSRRPKRAKEAKSITSTRKPTKSSKKVKEENDDIEHTTLFVKSRDGESGAHTVFSNDELNLGLNQVVFDDSSMPVPICSCTGVLRPCYKWGNGGWQSSCCTTNLSMYPLPAVPNKRHARVGGRKMSGSAFNKLLSRLAAEGHDLSNPVDLKDHWAKHGTNRYITIK